MITRFPWLLPLKHRQALKVLEVLEASEPPVLQQFQARQVETPKIRRVVPDRFLHHFQDQFGALQGMHVVAKDCHSFNCL